MTKANGHYQEFQPIERRDIEAISSFSASIEPELSHAGCNSSLPALETDGTVLRDGRILDLIRTQEKLGWLVWDNGQYTIANQVEFEGQVYVPPSLARGLGSALRLPTGLGLHLTAQELLAEMERYVLTFVDLAEGDAFLVSVFSLCTFFSDRLPVAPYMAICGPPGSAKSTLLRVLQCVTRRGLHAGEMSRASLYKLADCIRPTLLIDESDFDGGKASREIMRLLRAGNRRGADVYINGQRFRTFGPKVISSRTPLGDAALASRCLPFTMLPTRKNVPVLDEEAEQAIADDMQGKLERYRLEHYHEVRMPQNMEVGGLTPRMREIARVLAAPMLGNPELVLRLLAFLKQRDESARLDLCGEPEWAVAAGLFASCHRPGLELYVGNLTEEVNRILLENGETHRLSAKKVGGIARKCLRAHTVKQGRGFYLSLTADRKRQIHELARDMGLTRADILEPGTVRAGYAGPPCSLCTGLGLLTLADGTTLRSVELPKPRHQRERLFGLDWNSE